ncbi:uncharacterized protein TNCV_4957881 [Trichonephila clavipes]|nr:uncharacterized protein TNCV_4957881 [Trichonephila clavipes]
MRETIFVFSRVIFFDVPLETCLERMEPRRWDPTTGEMYHLKLRPCSERKALSRLIQLPEDSEDSIKADHELYSTHCVHLKSFFRTYPPEDIITEVDASLSEEVVFELAQGAILKSAKMKLPARE